MKRESHIMIGKTLRRLHRAAEWLQKRLTSRAVIVAYHRITNVQLDPWSMCVAPHHFDEHLQVVQKYAYPISLNQLAQAYRAGKVPQRAVVITFDDGYADNLYNAKPLLERYSIPATVFVTTGYVGSAREFWWDELERVLLQPGRLPENLCLKIGNRLQRWELATAVDYSTEDCQRDRNRRARDGQSGSRLAFYYSVWQQLQSLTAEERQHAQDELLVWAGAEPAARPLWRPLALEELHTLEQGGLVEIGAHTVTHPLFSAHAVTLQRDEIQRSKTSLEEWLNHPVTSFAYPFGDYTGETVPLVQEAGFSCACSAVNTTVWRQSDCWQFPRFEVSNWNGEAFKKQLLRWFRC
jgi:peptidoglycan/xylan/chitin deacetylase (PgdA/CDA1 family)